ncbi:DgyrCDS8731 [Dimorphilus gyrociliatus]|uniref:Anion exchange protein n=1 Tax=Dimorphilus gyrociliatus TaxID=2664684 RepID=A0A7I8VWR7_9ANNE|nr:DgyrCDS8731 [Dimorphilus gyrociliatus]
MMFDGKEENEDNQEFGTVPLRDYGNLAHVPYGDEEQDAQSHHREHYVVPSMFTALHGQPKSTHDSFRRGRHRRRRAMSIESKRGNHSKDGKKKKSNTEVVEENKEETTPKFPFPLPRSESTTTQNSSDGRTMTMMQRNSSSHRMQELLEGKHDDDDDDKEHIDHTPHTLFCEMDVLRIESSGEKQFHETARWLKFEEDVEEEGERWSKPHVAALPLHSLFQLRDMFASRCAFCFDILARTRGTILENIMDELCNMSLLQESKKEDVYRIMMANVVHLHEVGKHNHSGLPIIRSMKEIADRKMSRKSNSMEDDEGSLSRRSSTASLNGMPNVVHKQNAHFRKKIPPDAEATNVLVAATEIVDEPMMSFVRLRESSSLDDVTEVNVPTRFMIIILGPTELHAELHEMGRCISTLMSDEIFHEVAYKGVTTEDFLAGIDEFLDEVTVLPPSEWDPTVRLEPPKAIPDAHTRKKSIIVGELVNPLFHQDDDKDDDDSHSDTTLVRTGKLFGGLVQDVRRKAPFYLSDLKDCLHSQCIASIFFMYFACLTPIVTFGGLLGEATEDNIAVMESIFAGALCGVTYHFLAGQPLTIIGSTGPVLVFETITFELCKSLDLNYLSLRFWIGLWACLILLLIVAFDLSALVKYITRFTEESFAFLIAAIFIVEAFTKVLDIQNDYPVNTNYNDVPKCNCATPFNYTYSNSSVPPNLSNLTIPFNSSNLTTNDYQSVKLRYGDFSKEECQNRNGTVVDPLCFPKDNVYYFSILLFVGTFTVAMYLKGFRNYKFFPAVVKSILSDFSVMISIIIFCLVDYLVGIKTPKLNVPESFQPTKPDSRGWFINPFNGNPWWTALIAVVPALLATILIFMDQQITAVIVNRKEHKLKKGGGYHLDLFIIAIEIGLCSILGLPWFVAATVLSINHVRSLSRESECAAPGERPKFLGVREQRVTGIIVFLLVGFSVLITPILKYVPMPVLFGVFLYMGISSLKGVQLMQRIFLYIIPKKYQPDYTFLRHVRLIRVHLFTFIQIVCLGILWGIKKGKEAAIAFPVMVLAMCFVRMALDKLFTRHELKWLDDIMPQSHRKKEDDKKKKKKKKAEEEDDSTIEVSGGVVNLQLPSGETVNIALERIKYDPKTKLLKISEEIKQSNANFEKFVNDRSNKKDKNDVEKCNLPKPPSSLSSGRKSCDAEGEANHVKFFIANEGEANQISES